MNNLHIGTCSWKYDSWRGIVYPEFGDFNYLEEYSKKFNTVEIDQWFWSLNNKRVTLPKAAVVNEYFNSVPRNFLFSIKVPNSITLTHEYGTKEPNPNFLSNDLVNDFLFSIENLKSKIGILMFQFEYLNKEKMRSQTEFQLQLEKLFSNLNREYNYAVEVRNPNYLNEEFFNFLKIHDISFVFLQGYFLPQITDVLIKAENFLTNKIVIRLHGYDRKAIEKKTKEIWNSIVEPKDNELTRIVGMVNNLLDKKIDIFLNVNNHYEGSAPLTIEKIENMMKISN